jgi:hypothetical protein
VDAEALDTSLVKGLHQARVDGGRIGNVLRRTRWQALPMGDTPGQLGIVPYLIEKRL